jgi:DNA-binding IclR family transcriptional regulator
MTASEMVSVNSPNVALGLGITTVITVTSLTGLELADHILMRIVEEGDSVEELTQGLDRKESYVSALTSILKDVGWIDQDPSGKYIITDKGNSEAQNY